MTVADNEFPESAGTSRHCIRFKGVNPATYPSSAIDSSLDQQDYYGVLALNGVIGENVDYQLAYAIHYNTQTFNPDPIGDLIYQGISPKVFNSDLANTLQEDTTYRLGVSHLRARAFTWANMVWKSDNTSQVFREDSNGVQIPPFCADTVVANLNKINILSDSTLQDTWQITPKFSVNFGSRWDRADGFR